MSRPASHNIANFVNTAVRQNLLASIFSHVEDQHELIGLAVGKELVFNARDKSGKKLKNLYLLSLRRVDKFNLMFK